MEVLCGLAKWSKVGIIGDWMGKLEEMENTGWEGRMSDLI
jgi:hypothetical protein